jgi:hypothetical protein
MEKSVDPLIGLVCRPLPQNFYERARRRKNASF